MDYLRAKTLPVPERVERSIDLGGQAVWRWFRTKAWGKHDLSLRQLLPTGAAELRSIRFV
jgi:hypothetical protein